MRPSVERTPTRWANFSVSRAATPPPRFRRSARPLVATLLDRLTPADCQVKPRSASPPERESARGEPMTRWTVACPRHDRRVPHRTVPPHLRRTTTWSPATPAPSSCLSVSSPCPATCRSLLDPKNVVVAAVDTVGSREAALQVAGDKWASRTARRMRFTSVRRLVHLSPATAVPTADRSGLGVFTTPPLSRRPGRHRKVRRSPPQGREFSRR